MTRHFPEETEDVLLNRKEASRELATLGIRRAPFYAREDLLHTVRRSTLHPSRPHALLSEKQAARMG